MRAILVSAFLLLALLCVIPILTVVGDSFLSQEGGLTLSHYVSAFAPATA